ncbi:hypothetical protein [Planococcus beigongshangi]|uniref:hypothetical protein n=1 Tax=Planococcus beigongshangi TaxID=2782536 RepID=UPI001EEF1C90|nr:hypothetical protein [Planococcus beigongshangi]
MTKYYFIGYFLMFPLVYIVSSFIWRFVIKSYDLAEVLTDTLSITAIYYVLISILFVLFGNKIHKREAS